MMTEKSYSLPKIDVCYQILPSMLRKFDKYARKDYFIGHTKEEFELWKIRTREMVKELLGFKKMEKSSLNPVTQEVTILPGNITREHIRIQVEPDVWMPMYLLIPADAGSHTRLFLCPPGHNGAGKYTVAGVRGYSAIEERILQYHYDYGLQLAQLGYVALCPDCRGFGERREDLADTKDSITALKGDCQILAHMGEPLGIPVAGMLAWDLMRAIDYLEERREWDIDHISCLGFSGGGMQTMWVSSLDDRVTLTVISGYLYGFRDSLLIMNRNCSCNYVPHLWEHFDMGDIASLIAPRPLLIQSCINDRLNGPRGIANVKEQVEIVRQAYKLYDAENCFFHEICEGSHQWHEEHIKEYLDKLTNTK